MKRQEVENQTVSKFNLRRANLSGVGRTDLPRSDFEMQRNAEKGKEP
jgi:hypothetical protein